MYRNNVIALLALLFSAVSLALPEDAQQQMTILSDSAELDRKAGVVVYKGNVVLTQGTLKIESDRLMILRSGDVVEQAVAEGSPARYQQQIQPGQQLTTAAGQRIDYFATRKQVQIKGNAQMQQEGNEFSGETIIYDITNERVQASSQTSSSKGSHSENTTPDKPQRIKVIIQPEAKAPAPASTNSEARRDDTPQESTD